MPLLSELEIFLLGGRGYKHGAPTVLSTRLAGRTDAKQSEIARLIFRVVDIVIPEFSLALRHSSGRCRCKLWPQNENLIFENDLNALASRWDSDRAKP